MTAKEQKRAAADFDARSFSPKATEGEIASRLFETYDKRAAAS